MKITGAQRQRCLVKAVRKYERQSGVKMRCNDGTKLIAEAISGRKMTKPECWAFLFNYAEGEVYKRTKKARRETPDNSSYSRSNALDLYASPEWRSLRVHIIEEQQGRCQMCGRSYKDHGVVIHVDHIIPLSIDWSRRLDKGNLQLLCEDCNLGKSNVYSTDWRAK